MNRHKGFRASGLLLAGMAAPLAAPALAAERFSAFDPYIEINATDGDVGFHTLLDGDAWRLAKMYDGDGDRMLKVRGTDDLDEQGVTELFFESAEPPCWYDAHDPDVDWGPEDVVTVEEFLERFEKGVYKAEGVTLEGKRLKGRDWLNHNLPAAPDVDVDVSEDEDGEVEVTIRWEGGNDLGKCPVPRGMNPARVKVVRWEVAVEPEEDELPDGLPFVKLTIQFPPEVTSFEVPEEFLQPYIDADVTDFKFEVGAREARGNQTFTEEEFSTEED